LCFNCLGRHTVSQCNSKHHCCIYTRKHHTSLCADTDKSTTERLLEQPFNNSGVQPPINTTTNATLTTPNNQHSMVSHTNKICLLKTAVATAMLKPKANILFDEGSQRSFLTSDLADALSLHPTKQEDICISTFGTDNPVSQKLDVASIKLKTRSGRYVPLSVLIVPNIAVPLTHTINSEVVQLPNLRELPLAHPVTTD